MKIQQLLEARVAPKGSLQNKKRLMKQILTAYNKASEEERRSYMSRGSKDWYTDKGAGSSKAMNQANKAFKKHFSDLIPDEDLEDFKLGNYETQDVDAFVEAWLSDQVEEAKSDKKKKTFPKKAEKKDTKLKSPKKYVSPLDDLDDTEDSIEDPESDKVPHLVMQLRKALDVEGNYPIMFKDGKKQKISMEEITSFLYKYLSTKPGDREAMQSAASGSYEGFKKASGMDVPKAPKSIYTG